MTSRSVEICSISASDRVFVSSFEESKVHSFSPAKLVAGTVISAMNEQRARELLGLTIRHS